MSVPQVPPTFEDRCNTLITQRGLKRTFAAALKALQLLAEALPYIEEGEEYNKESCRTLSKRVRDVLRVAYPDGGY